MSNKVGRELSREQGPPLQPSTPGVLLRLWAARKACVQLFLPLVNPSFSSVSSSNVVGSSESAGSGFQVQLCHVPPVSPGAEPQCSAPLHSYGTTVIWIPWCSIDPVLHRRVNDGTASYCKIYYLLFNPFPPVGYVGRFQFSTI